jgi:hypothetical protein
MAKILTTKGSSAALEDILLKAEKEVILISFNFIISQSFLKIIKRAIDKGVVVKMVYGKYIKMDDESTFNALPNLQTLHLPDLHAKIFANETKCIVGSMNFSQASEMNNTELGVLLTKSSDEKAFEEAIDHAKFIVKEAKVARPMIPKEIHDKHVPKKETENPKSLATSDKTTKEYSSNDKYKDYGHGFCIRTGEKIPLNHLKPLCEDAYSIWVEYGDNNYPEHFCHFTGEHSNGETSYAMPIMQKNWKKYVKITGYNVL